MIGTYDTKFDEKVAKVIELLNPILFSETSKVDFARKVVLELNKIETLSRR